MKRVKLLFLYIYKTIYDYIVIFYFIFEKEECIQEIDSVSCYVYF